MDAIIFDFDGVVVDSEPFHFAAFRRVLESRGRTLTREDYYAKYLGYDDRDCFLAVSRDGDQPLSDTEIAEMTAEKTAILKKALAESVKPLDGAVELIESAAAAGVAAAVCSGALREEIELALRGLGILGHFSAIVSAEDVSRGKPDPEGYNLALRRLVSAAGGDIAAGRCVAVEDSPAGIDAAKAAGMKVLAVTNSYDADVLAAADRVVDSLAGLTPDAIESLL